MIIKSSLGLSFGVVFSVLLFKRRAWPAWVGLGFGAGRAWEEADGMFTLSMLLDLANKIVISKSLAVIPTAFGGSPKSSKDVRLVASLPILLRSWNWSPAGYAE